MSNLIRVRKVIERLDLRGVFVMLAMKVYALPDSFDDTKVNVELRFRVLNSKRPSGTLADSVNLVMEKTLEMSDAPPDSWIVESLREFLHEALAHERDEGIYLDGKILNDPHARDG